MRLSLGWVIDWDLKNLRSELWTFSEYLTVIYGYYLHKENQGQVLSDPVWDIHTYIQRSIHIYNDNIYKKWGVFLLSFYEMTDKVF